MHLFFCRPKGVSTVVDKTNSVDSVESEINNSEELEENKVFTAEDIKAIQLEAKTYR